MTLFHVLKSLNNVIKSYILDIFEVLIMPLTYLDKYSVGTVIYFLHQY